MELVQCEFLLIHTSKGINPWRLSSFPVSWLWCMFIIELICLCFYNVKMIYFEITIKENFQTFLFTTRSYSFFILRIVTLQISKHIYICSNVKKMEGICWLLSVLVYMLIGHIFSINFLTHLGKWLNFALSDTHRCN